MNLSDHEAHLKGLHSIGDNLKFIIVEVTKQLENALEILNTPHEIELEEKVLARDDYIDNLKNFIENRCFSRILSNRPRYKKEVDAVRAVHSIATNLEHIGDYSVNIVRQVQHLHTPAFIKKYDYLKFFTVIFNAIEQIEPALYNRDTDLAMTICQAELTLDQYYKQCFDTIVEELHSSNEVNNLITSLLIFRNLEFIGDSLLNIGEAIISVVVGEKLKIHQYQAIEASLDDTGSDISFSDFAFAAIGETKSGCRIGRVYSKDQPNSEQHVIFKEGKMDKILQEKASIETWETLFPGLPPKVITFHKHGANASVLLENLPGETFQSIATSGTDTRTLKTAFGLLIHHLETIWLKTKKEENISADFVKQVLNRLEDVLTAHPEFQTSGVQIGELRTSSLNDLIDSVMNLDKRFCAPFSIFIHGDFNIDNIICDIDSQRIHFIDLHRSKYQDYLQDVSVFIISNFRLPLFDRPIRNRLNWVILEFLEFTRSFAQKYGDETMEVRLALGLARSFLTSTRFQFHPNFAKDMYSRAVYLLERVLEHQHTDWKGFKIPDALLTY